MHTITFTCETITPMFLSGADGTTPELRPPSIKGALRFWWRAMNGHLDLKTLKEQESLIFGGTDGESGGRSRVIIRAKPLNMQTEEAVLVPHKSFMRQKAFKIKQKFEITLGLISNTVFTFAQLQALFELVCILGGFGKRSRRGMGSVKTTKIDQQNYVQPDTKGIETMLNRINNKFILTNNIIYSDFRRVQTYATIKEIQIGNVKNDILRRISDTTHKFHTKEKPLIYNINFGGTNFIEEKASFEKGIKVVTKRFASPVYVSTLQEGNNLKSIVTILHTEPQFDKHLVKPDLQQEFKREVL